MKPKFGPVLSSTARVSQRFGANPSYYGPLGFAGHEGVDLAIGIGSIISAATGGKVLFAGDKGNNYGKYIDIWDADQNVRTLYAHLSEIVVKTGDSIEEGQSLGHVGNTGRSTNPHLHFGAMRTKALSKGIPIVNPISVQTTEPLNPNNGYKGWENPFDGNLFDWPLVWYPTMSGGTYPPSVGEQITAAEAKFGGLTFAEIFNKYYAGWGKLEAEADFFKTQGGDLTKLLVSRGVPLEEVKKKVTARPKALKKLYPVNPAFVGLTLNKINSAGIPLGRTDVLSNFLGFGPDSPILPGQLLDPSGFPSEYYPISSEWKGFLHLTSKTPPGIPGGWYILPEYDGLNLQQIGEKAGGIGRTDVLAGFLGISQDMPISKYKGFGTLGFHPSYIPNSSEWSGFNKVFTQNAPPAVQSEGEEPAENIPNVPQVRITNLGPSITVKSTPPRAKFYIDGLYFKDLTPANKPYLVAKGKHTVRIEKTGYNDYEAEYDVGEDEQLEVNITLTPETVQAEPTPVPRATTNQRLTDLEARVTAIEAKIA